MLPFFRKIRWRLAQDNQFLKYSRYAVGEIVLVVMGIMIALQVNTWNKNREARSLAKNTLIDLRQEIDKNQKLLSLTQESIEESLLSTDILLENIRQEPVEEFDSIDLIIVHVIYSPKYTPSKDVFNSLFTTGVINYIDNSELRYKLTNWNSLLDEYNYWIEVNETVVIEHLLPFLYKNYNLANYELGENMMPPNRSGFPFDSSELLANREFENLVSQRRINIVVLESYYKNLGLIQEELKGLIESELMN